MGALTEGLNPNERPTLDHEYVMQHQQRTIRWLSLIIAGLVIFCGTLLIIIAQLASRRPSVIYFSSTRVECYGPTYNYSHIGGGISLGTPTYTPPSIDYDIDPPTDDPEGGASQIDRY